MLLDLFTHSILFTVFSTLLSNCLLPFTCLDLTSIISYPFFFISCCFLSIPFLFLLHILLFAVCLFQLFRLVPFSFHFFSYLNVYLFSLFFSHYLFSLCHFLSFHISSSFSSFLIYNLSLSRYAFRFSFFFQYYI